MLQRGSIAYQFNSDGFLTQRGDDTFLYSTRGQLLEASVGSQHINYSYDGLGRRVSRTDESGTYQYLYGDPSSHIVTAMRSPTGELSTLYYDTTGFLIALERDGARYYVATDQVGTPMVVSNSTGALVKVVEYDSFGNVITDSNPAFAPCCWAIRAIFSCMLKIIPLATATHLASFVLVSLYMLALAGGSRPASL